MAIADYKERVAVTLDRSTVEQIKEIAERESRSLSNVVQILADHGLRDREKYRLAPSWCDQILHKHITFERVWPQGEDGDEESQFDEVHEAGPVIYLDIGFVVEVVEWRDTMRMVVEVDRRDDYGNATGEKELLFVFPQEVVKVVGDHGKMLFSRMTEKPPFADIAEKLPQPPPAPPPPVKRKRGRKPKQGSK